ncbi:uncharacterized protein [Lolium perenne]|uniref:uncharacterized protein n=1 Tax=Lolium perenne TaxID=4522 RepID=UPI003A9A2546
MGLDIFEEEASSDRREPLKPEEGIRRGNHRLVWDPGHLVAARKRSQDTNSDHKPSEIYGKGYLVCRNVIFGIELFQQRSESSPEGMCLPHEPPSLKTISSGGETKEELWRHLPKTKLSGYYYWLVVGDLVLNVISVYASQVGHNESTKREFWEGLEDLVRRVPIGEKLFIGGDLNGHVGTSNTGFERVHGGFGYGIRNQEGEDVLSFALAYDMVVANTLFRKRESHLVTFSSGLHSSQIDFVLSRREDRRACIDFKAIPSVVPQHKLVVADFRFRIRVQRGKHAKVARTKWWKLKGEASQAFRERVIKESPWEEGGDANMMWTSMTTCLRKVVVEEFGVTKGSRREAKDTWWWNDEVQKVIREKKDCFRCLYLDRSAANMEKYKMDKKAAKRAVSEARGRAYEDLYQRLNTKEGERDIYKMAKFRERKTRDVNEVKCIKDGEDQLLVKDDAIKRRWREYFDNLYNGEVESSTIELDDSFDDTSMCFVRRIQESGVKEALRRMKGGNAMGPDGYSMYIPIPYTATHS